jgi:hypothetical protein
VLAGLAWGGAAAAAAPTLEVRIVRGGLDLEFGEVGPGEPSRTEELELLVTGDGSGRYRMYQEAPDLLVNERGRRLPEGTLVMQLSRGLTGTRGAEGIVPVSQDAQELFVSDSAGSSDTLLIAYAIQPGASLAAGTYQGILRFTLESLDTGAVVTQTVTMRATVAAAVGLEPEGPDSTRLDLGEIEPGSRSDVRELVFRIWNNTAVPTQVTHRLAEPRTNAQGQGLPEDALTLAVHSDAGTEAWRPASAAPEVVATDEEGALSSLRVTYAVEVPPTQSAGRYAGMLQYGLVSLGVPGTQEELVPVELVVTEVFTLSVTPLDVGAGRLHFSLPAATGGPVESSLAVEVRTNVGRPYQVLAGLDHPLVLETGETLPADSLRWTVSSVQHGSALIGTESPVAVNYTPVYQSDAAGSPDAFVMTYRLAVPPDSPSGVYSGRIRFTITPL